MKASPINVQKITSIGLYKEMADGCISGTLLLCTYWTSSNITCESAPACPVLVKGIPLWSSHLKSSTKFHTYKSKLILGLWPGCLKWFCYMHKLSLYCLLW